MNEQKYSTVYNFIFLGFTLVELLVTLGIISLLFTLGYANFRGYQRKQAVMAVARQIEGDIRLAQEYASQGFKYGTCSNRGLLGYVFQINSNNTYSLIADCNLGNGNPKIKDSIAIPTGISLSPATSIKFKVLSEGPDLANDIVVRLTSTENIIVEILISKSGNITVGFSSST